MERSRRADRSRTGPPGGRRAARRTLAATALVLACGPAADPQGATQPPPRPVVRGLPAAQALLERAEGLYSGTSGWLDCIEGKRLFLKAAAAGDALANLRVATLRAFGRCGFEVDKAKASRDALPLLAAVQKLADAGDPYARYLVGLTHSGGIGRPENHLAANQLFLQAAEAGEVWAMWNLAWAYQSGHGVPEDAATAVDWYERAAEAGHAMAMTEVGEACLGVRGGRSRDPEAAKAWYERGAERGERGAMTRLGEMHWRGDGVERDLATAIDWLLRAAELGESLAMYHLAHASFDGKGLPEDWAAGAEWLQAAAEKGFYYAVFEMAQLYEQGLHWRGKPVIVADEARATHWYRRAAELGHPDAHAWLERR